MSYTYLQEQGEESSAGYFSDIPQYVLSRLNLTAERSCSNDNEMESCPSSQSGMMSAHSTGLRGGGKLMSSAEDSLVKTSALLDEERESKGSEADSGKRWQGLLVRYDQDMFSSKIALCSEQEDSALFSKTLPKWGMMQDGECLEVKQLVFASTEKESGFSLMRPTASDGLRHKMKLSSLIRKNHQDGNLSEQLARVHQVKLTPPASEILMGWPEMWTDLSPSGTDKFQAWRQQHSES